MFKTTAQREWHRMYQITEHVVPAVAVLLQLVRRCWRARRVVQSASAQHRRRRAEWERGHRPWRGGSASPSAAVFASSCVLDPQPSERELLTAWKAPAMILSECPSWIRFWSCISIGMQTTSSNTNPPQVKLEMLVGKDPRRSFIWAHCLSLTHKRSWGRKALTKQNSELWCTAAVRAGSLKTAHWERGSMWSSDVETFRK